MERVRELVAVGLDDDKDNGTAGVQMTTTISVVTDVEDSALTVPSLECEGQVSARAGTKVAPLVQVGTLMLTEDELHRTSDGHNAEQASQQQAMRAAFMSEVAQAQQGDGGVLSAFAAALHARRVETTFGDGVSDSD
jgi:urease gamma subunit